MTTLKRPDYLSWSDYFMATANLAAQRSKDPTAQSGAVIVDSQNRIVAVGYNGLPRGCNDDLFPWHDDASADHQSLNNKRMYVCHAELNAVLNRNGAAVNGCTMYVAAFPCNECSKVIIQSGIRSIVYLTDMHAEQSEYQASRRMFEATGIRCEKYVMASKRLRIELNFKIAADDCVGDCATEIETKRDIVDHSMSIGEGSTGISKGKRIGYLSWSDFFMAVSLLAAQRSKDPNTQVGACIVNSNMQIVGIGYNGFPRGCSDDAFPWRRPQAPTVSSENIDDALDNKYLYVCHAEVNAILNKNAADVHGCTIYVALFPCNECAKVIIQSGIDRVVYLCDKYGWTTGAMAARRMFKAAGVQCERFVTDKQHVIIDMKENH